MVMVILGDVSLISTNDSALFFIHSAEVVGVKVLLNSRGHSTNDNKI